MRPAFKKEFIEHDRVCRVHCLSVSAFIKRRRLKQIDSEEISAVRESLGLSSLMWFGRGSCFVNTPVNNYPRARFNENYEGIHCNRTDPDSHLQEPQRNNHIKSDNGSQISAEKQDIQVQCTADGDHEINTIIKSRQVESTWDGTSDNTRRYTVDQSDQLCKVVLVFSNDTITAFS